MAGPFIGAIPGGWQEPLRSAVVEVVMQDAVSKSVHGACWLAAVLTTLATGYWLLVAATGNYCWGAFAFAFGMAAPLGVGTLLLGVVPAGGLYWRKKDQRDLKSLWLAGGSCAALLVEVLLLFYAIPMRGE